MRTHIHAHTHAQSLSHWQEIRLQNVRRQYEDRDDDETEDPTGNTTSASNTTSDTPTRVLRNSTTTATAATTATLTPPAGEEEEARTISEADLDESQNDPDYGIICSAAEDVSIYYIQWLYKGTYNKREIM